MVEQNKVVTPEMMEAAMAALNQMGVGKMSRKIENRDIVYEMLEAAAKAGGKIAAGTFTKDEAGWAEFFRQCFVIVNDPDVGQTMFRKGLESAAGFKELIGMVSKHGAIVVPLTAYPGITLFRAAELEPVKKNSKQAKE